MSFPNYKIVEEKHLFGLWYSLKKEKDGWEDLGQKESWYESDGKSYSTSHTFCGTKVHIGKNLDTQDAVPIFKFCPRCKVQIVETPKNK